MFTQAVPSSATLATSTSSVSPASPPRVGRLRGLSYLRSYTHNHILSRDSNNTQRPSNVSRATSFPTPEPSAAVSESASSAVPTPPPRRNNPRLHRSISDFGNSTSGQELSPATSGWVPTVGGQSGVAPIATQSQSTETVSSSAVLSANSPSSLPLNTNLAAMARTRAPTSANNGTPELLQLDTLPSQNLTRSLSHVGNREPLPSIRFSAHQDENRGTRPSLVFSPMSRTLPTGSEVIRVGRYSERDDKPALAPNVPSAAAVGFKSKVVSRRHCEFWFQAGRWYIKDVKSSSGTFLNHIRLSSPGTESKPFAVNDGDIVQLGIDFKGGEEMIFRCVKIRVELNRGWQSGLNKFNVKAHKRLREMSKSTSVTGSSSSQDCSICLGAIAPCQSLFVAPCSHTWHFKCIRVILNGPQFPHFLCPNCRAVADLEAEVDDPYNDCDWEEVDYEDSEVIDAKPVRSLKEDRPADPMDEDSDDIQHVAPHATEDTAQHLTSNGIAEDTEMQVDEETSHSSVSPVPIRSRGPSCSRPSANVEIQDSSSSEELNDARTPSPASHLPLPEFLGADGPMTPRNDVGPFIFDGSAGLRAAQTRMHSALMVENSPPVREA